MKKYCTHILKTLNNQQKHNHTYKAGKDFDTIPLLNLENLDNILRDFDSKVAQKQKMDLVNQVKEIGQNVGFFYIKNHGISEDFLKNVRQQQIKFFNLPQEEKMKVHISQGPDYSGYSYLGEELTLGKKDMKETVEYFKIKDIDKLKRNKSQEVHDYSRYFLSNPKFPQSQEVEQFQNYIENYMDELNKVGYNLMQLFALAMNLPQDYFQQNGIIDNNFSILRMNAYSPNKQKDSQNKEDGIGIGPHVDPGWLGILSQDQVGGLQVLNNKRQWIDATPIENTFIVNMGETMELVTNGLFKATPHRVINKSQERQRFSNVLFFEPNLDAFIQPVQHQNLQQKQQNNNVNTLYKDIEIAHSMTDEWKNGIVYGELVLGQYKRGYPNKVLEQQSI